MLYRCKNCGSYQQWRQCNKCGKVVCLSCGLKGVGGYPKMRAQNACGYCKMGCNFIILKGTEDILKNYGK